MLLCLLNRHPTLRVGVCEGFNLLIRYPTKMANLTYRFVVRLSLGEAIGGKEVLPIGCHTQMGQRVCGKGYKLLSEPKAEEEWVGACLTFEGEASILTERDRV